MCEYIYIYIHTYIHAQLFQLYLTLCNSMDCSLPDSFVHGMLQARILKSVAMPFSRGCSRPRTEPTSSTSPALGGSSLPAAPLGKTHTYIKLEIININVCVCVYSNHKPRTYNVPCAQSLSCALLFVTLWTVAQ